MLKINDHVGIVCCSNPLPPDKKDEVKRLTECLMRMGLVPQLSAYLFQDGNYRFNQISGKSEELMNYYKDQKIKAVFDISGGDLSNGMLSFIDFEVINNNNKPFFGYSDLTTILNGIYSMTGGQAYLYQIRNLVSKDYVVQRKSFYESLFGGKDSLFQYEYSFYKGNYLNGIIIGGNIRCFLKLAGTPFFPETDDKILFLESMSGKMERIITYFYQLRQMKVFQKIKGVILGTFTEFERNNCPYCVEKLLFEISDNKELIIVKTQEIGHNSNSKGLIIGKEVTLYK